MVTYSTTNQPIFCLRIAERTGCPVTHLFRKKGANNGIAPVPFYTAHDGATLGFPKHPKKFPPLLTPSVELGSIFHFRVSLRNFRVFSPSHTFQKSLLLHAQRHILSVDIVLLITFSLLLLVSIAKLIPWAPLSLFTLLIEERNHCKHSTTDIKL